MTSLLVRIHLPPGLPPDPVIRETLHLIFEEFHWFQPIAYDGVGIWEDRAIPPGPIPLDELVAACRGEEWHASHMLTVKRSDDEFLMFSLAAKNQPYPYVGKILWETIASFAFQAEGRRGLEEQVTKLMKLLKSPFAMAALSEDYDSKAQRLVPEDVGLSLELTIENYTEGLAGLFWRNFYGPPFVELFGKGLNALPAECRKDLGDGIVLVKPYEMPSDAETEAGKARERELISLLGPECFYDHERHVKPTRVPRLPASWRDGSSPW